MNKIKFVTYKVIQTVFNPSDSVISKLENISTGFDCSDDFKNSLSFSPIYPEDNDKVFFVVFDLDMSDPRDLNDDTHQGLFYVKFIAQFECEHRIGDKFKSSNFPVINAPAIAYPFLRTFVHNYFLNAGYEPVLLPTYNFVNAKKRTD